ncbi:TIGR01777 family oxidoreductase [Robiginitalea sp. IMCC43444]|uniref:TIGR01777 family oxidoreductase n=1 Tax=Robiginitalea sp. IMCC43444 TaxID=3459121 RepID=UPI0040414981
MKVLITGATGLVGTALTKAFRSEGVSVHYLTTRKSKVEADPDYRGFYWNPAEGEIDTACFEGVSVLINLAGSSISQRWTAKNKKRIIESRTQSIDTLIKGLQSYGTSELEYVLGASAIGIYPSSQTEYYTEANTAVDDSFLGVTVKLWEEHMKGFEELGIPYSIVRIGLVMTADGGALPQIARPVKYYVGAPLGSGDQWQSWIHLEDLSGMITFLVDQRLEGIYNAVSPNPVCNRKLTKEIGEVLSKPVFLPSIPAGLLRLVLGEMAYILLASQRVSCEKIQMEGFSFQFPNIHQALQDLL